MDQPITNRNPIVGKLRFDEAQHGWALDVGSFLAAWSTSIRALMSSGSDEVRLGFIRHARLYAFNIARRLSAAGIEVDSKKFEPKDLQQMHGIFDDILATVRERKSAAHCAILLLGMATTYVSLSLKPGMPGECQRIAEECARASIRRLQQLGQYPAGTHVENIRTELLKLEGNIDNVRGVLQESNKAGYRILQNQVSNHKVESIVTETELPDLIQQTVL